MKTIIAKALFNSHSYLEYRKLIADLLLQNKSTGNEQSEALLNYSQLNDTRMKRLDKTIHLTEELIEALQSLKKNYLWLVLAEGWCADGAQIIPVLNQMAEESNGKIDLKIVLRDENEDFMNLFLTNKTKSIPKLIVVNRETGTALAHWGSRPKGAMDFIKTYKEENGLVDEKGKADLQLWYLHDKGITTQSEVIDMMLDLDK